MCSPFTIVPNFEFKSDTVILVRACGRVCFSVSKELYHLLGDRTPSRGVTPDTSITICFREIVLFALVLSDMARWTSNRQ